MKVRSQELVRRLELYLEKHPEDNKTIQILEDLIDPDDNILTDFLEKKNTHGDLSYKFTDGVLVHREVKISRRRRLRRQ